MTGLQSRRFCYTTKASMFVSIILVMCFNPNMPMLCFYIHDDTILCWLQLNTQEKFKI